MVAEYEAMAPAPRLPVWKKSRPESGAHELLHAVLVGGSEEEPPPSREELVELGAKVVDVFQAKLLKVSKRRGVTSLQDFLGSQMFLKGGSTAAVG